MLHILFVYADLLPDTFFQILDLYWNKLNKAVCVVLTGNQINRKYIEVLLSKFNCPIVNLEDTEDPIVAAARFANWVSKFKIKPVWDSDFKKSNVCQDNRPISNYTIYVFGPEIVIITMDVCILKSHLPSVFKPSRLHSFSNGKVMPWDSKIDLEKFETKLNIDL